MDYIRIKNLHPQLLSLRVWSLCSSTREAAIVRGPRTAMKSGPRLPQLEKALAQKRRPNTAKNKKIKKKKIKKKEFLKKKKKNLRASKDTVSRVKKQPMKWEKIFANHISEKLLIPRIRKELLQFKITQLKNGENT